MSEKKGVIEFGSKADDASYRDRIAAARNKTNSHKSSEPVGKVERPQLPVLAREPRQTVEDISFPGQQGVQPRPAGSPVLRPETQQQLAELAAAQERMKAEEAAPAKEESKEEEVDPNILDMLDFDGRNEAERILNNKKRRKDIEARCEPMDLTDLIVNDEVQQTVPILPGKLEPTYRSYTPAEGLFIKRFMAREQHVSEAYLTEKFGMCQLTLSLVAINGRSLPDHRNADGVVDEDLFKKKLEFLCKKDGYLIADLGVNYAWFDLRVRKLFNPDDVKNG